MPDVKGYRKLSDEDIADMNRVKDMEKKVGELWRELSQFEDIDKRWLAIAKTHLQEGFMAFVRAIAKPEDVF
jgi:hypothetical protein